MTMLPSDRYLCSLLGLTEEEFQSFQADARQYLKENPIEGPVAGGDPVTLTLAIVSAVLSVGATVASMLLRPSVPDAGGGPRAIKRTDNIDDPVITNQSFSPRYGFDSVQNVVKVGSTVPLVYGNRSVGGAKVGGVRVSMPLVWSQMLSFGTSQMLRSIFLAGEGEVGGFDNDLWAVGSNLLKNYKYTTDSATQIAARATIYASLDSGTIVENDRVFGRSGTNDRRTNGGGSSATSGTGEVFKIQAGSSPTETVAFSSVHTPSSSTTFGVYSLIGNDLCFKVNPVVRPGVKVNQRAQSGSNFEVRCPKDGPQIAMRRKFRYNYASFSGITKKNGVNSSGTRSLIPGDDVTYVLFKESEKEITFTENNTSEASKDVASSVASRQTYYDQNLIIGEIYKIGSAIGVCTSRSPSDGVFRSEADEVGSTQQIDVTFEIVEPGSVDTYTEAHLKGAYNGGMTVDNPNPVSRAVATTFGHILRYAQAVVTNTRACDITEIGFTSTLGHRINGLCNFKDAKTYEVADNLFCDAQNSTSNYDSEFYQSNTLSVSVKRFAFFTLQYKEMNADTDNDWVDSGKIFAVQSETMQPVFNFLRVEFTTAKLRIFRLRPITGFEIRQKTSGNFFLLDANEGFQYQTVASYGGAAVKVAFNGKIFSHPFHNDVRSKFGEATTGLTTSYAKELINGDPDVTFESLEAVDTEIGTGYSAMIDEFMTCAEDFIYEEISSSAKNGPEHSVSYVNEIVTGQTGNYSNLALVGINIRSSTEWQQFTQFSGYVKEGIKSRRLDSYTGLPFNPTPNHLYRFPEILLDLMSNDRYGMGDLIKDEMIDIAGFKEANDWCQSRSYFFNGVVADQINLRQYAADLAATHLLYFAEINGQFTLKPALPVSGSTFVAADIKGLFTVGNILEDSYQIEYLNPEDREPIEVSVTYREERSSSDLSSEGAFSTVKEALIKEASYTPLDTVSLDMTDYCTQRDHAIDAAKFIIRMRRLTDHVVRFKVTHESIYNNIAPGDYINVAMDATEYSDFSNGVVTGAGDLVTSEAFADGSYSVFAWDPNSGNDPSVQTLVVTGSGTRATPTGVIFTEIKSSQESRTYQVEQITADQDGTFTIEALHMPVTGAGIPLVADGFDTASNWTIT